MGITHSQIACGRCRQLHGNGQRGKVPLWQVRLEWSQLSIDDLLRSGYRIRDEEEIRDGETYYLTAGEQFEMCEIRLDNESVVLHFPMHTLRSDSTEISILLTVLEIIPDNRISTIKHPRMDTFLHLERIHWEENRESVSHRYRLTDLPYSSTVILACEQSSSSFVVVYCIRRSNRLWLR